MSWKNVKTHYRIEHIVQLRDGKICIGSGYIHDLIRVTLNGEVSWGNLGPSYNDDLARYFAEMAADLSLLRELIQAPDSFAASLPVYTYDGGEVIEKQCEAHGWPNLTHDGALMYQNTFSPDKAQAVKWAKNSADIGVKWARERLVETEAKLVDCRKQLASEEADRAKLEADFPALATETAVATP